MTMVDDGAAGPVHAVGAHEPTTRRPSAVAVPCAARPGSRLAHLDGPCPCFFGGPPPVWVDGPARLQVHD